MHHSQRFFHILSLHLGGVGTEGVDTYLERWRQHGRALNSHVGLGSMSSTHKPIADGLAVMYGVGEVLGMYWRNTKLPVIGWAERHKDAALDAAPQWNAG